MMMEEGLISTLLVLAGTLVLFALITFLQSVLWPAIAQPPMMPPGPRPWPIFGNLPLLAATHAHRTLAELAKQYGTPLLSLRLGTMPALVACTGDMAREFLHTHDSNFSDRPDFGMPNHLLFGVDNIIGFQNSGPRWRSLRKLWTTQLLSHSQIAKNQHVRHEEVSNMLATIKAESLKADGAAQLNVLTCVAHVTGNIMGRLLLSQRLFDSVTRPHKLHGIIEETLNLMFTPLVGDFVPFLSWLDFPTKRKMAATRGRVNELMGSIVGERLQLRAEQKPHFNDILDLLLNESGGRVDSESLGFINGTLLEMFIAGVDTSANTMAWTMAELLCNPVEMAKVQKEIEEAVGLERIVMESDLPKLDYLRAVIKEVFRLHPIAVMMIPHASKQDCKVAGYVIPAKTRLFVNLWAIGRDASVWENPSQFVPERFMGSSIDVKGQHFELLPFGSGRRMCPGMAQGLIVVELTLANLIHCFNWSALPGNTIDLSESKSTAGSLTLATPLIATPTFRLNMPNFP